MATKTTGTKAAGYEAKLGRTDAGSVKVTIGQAGPWKDRDHSLMAERLLSARIYEIAAALEKLAAIRGDRWPVSPRAYDCVIVIECDEHEVAGVEQLLVETLKVESIRVVR